MALPILDGNQTSTTLATTVSGGAHYPNHIISSGAVTANIGNAPNFIGGGYTNLTEVLNDGAIVVQSIETTVNANVSEVAALPPITGTVTANVYGRNVNGGAPIAFPIASGNDNFVEEGARLGVQLLKNDGTPLDETGILPISGTVTANGVWESNLVPSVRGEGDGAISLGIAVAFGRNVDGTAIVSEATPFPITGAVTANVANSITVGALPVQLSTTTIGGTSRLNVTLSSATTVGAIAPSYGNLSGGSDGTNFRAILTDTSGRTVVTGSTSILGTPSVTFSAIAGTVTANVSSTTVTVSALPSGALTTRFGSVTTANTSQLTSCVTNSSRKYLLAQNISAGTVTIGIGFSPTTTQGIQLTAGAGITFDSFCPTGAVWWLGATTGATWTILEG